MNYLQDIQTRFRRYAELRRLQQQQTGEGVVTRKQAKLEDQAVPEPAPKVPELPELVERTEPEAPPEPLNIAEEAEDQLPEAITNGEKSETEEGEAGESTEPPDTLFNDETLVAENESLKAYVVKVFFKRQKRFQFEDHQVPIHNTFIAVKLVQLASFVIKIFVKGWN